MKEPDAYLLVKSAYTAARADQMRETPDMPEAPQWEALGIALRDAIARVYFAGGTDAVQRFSEKMQEAMEHQYHTKKGMH